MPIEGRPPDDPSVVVRVLRAARAGEPVRLLLPSFCDRGRASKGGRLRSRHAAPGASWLKAGAAAGILAGRGGMHIVLISRPGAHGSGAGGGTRTRTGLRPREFKSHASTIPPRPRRGLASGRGGDWQASAEGFRLGQSCSRRDRVGSAFQSAAGDAEGARLRLGIFAAMLCRWASWWRIPRRGRREARGRAAGRLPRPAHDGPPAAGRAAMTRSGKSSDRRPDVPCAPGFG